MRPLITRLTLVLTGLLVLSFARAQSPELISYQAVARDAETGAELSNQSIYIVIKVRAESADGDIVYQEEHANVATNAFGLFNISIGGGNPIAGQFSEIDWGRNLHWLEIDMDAGDGLETLGSMQLVSVPYALHAKTVENTNDADADPTNELIDALVLSDDYLLSIGQGANVMSVELGQMMNLDDIDPSNELVDSLSLGNDYILTIGEGDNIQSVALGGMVNFDDVDPTNELIEEIVLREDFVLSVSEGGATFNVDLSSMVDTLDTDPMNELQTLAEVIAHSSPIGSAGNQRITELAAPLSANDAATKSYVDGLVLSGDIVGTPGNTTVEGIQNTPVSTTSPVDGQIMTYNGTLGQWEPAAPASNSLTQYFSIDIADFVGGSEANDADDPNIAIYDTDPIEVSVDRTSGSNMIYAPVHLPHGAPITEFAVYFRKLSFMGNLSARLVRQHLPTGTREAIAVMSTAFSSISGLQMVMAPIDSSGEKNIIDNSQYSYRIEVSFSKTFDQSDQSEVRISFMGATIKCN